MPFAANVFLKPNDIHQLLEVSFKFSNVLLLLLIESKHSLFYSFCKHLLTPILLDDRHFERTGDDKTQEPSISALKETRKAMSKCRINAVIIIFKILLLPSCELHILFFTFLPTKWKNGTILSVYSICYYNYLCFCLTLQLVYMLTEAQELAFCSKDHQGNSQVQNALRWLINILCWALNSTML